MFTLGYSFRPWTQALAIADGPSIRDYVRDTAEEYGVVPHIRFGHRIDRAEWSSEDARWRITAEREDGERVTLTCSFFWGCSGYYSYEDPYAPEFPGAGDFRGPVIHPQHWPDDLDYTGKRVAIIGSGATAVTLVPAMAERAEHVTMIQRSPSYMIALPAEDPLADWLRGRLSPQRAYSIVRWKNALLQQLTFAIARRWPDFARRVLRRGLLKHLPPDYDIDTHFSPEYDVWDQRLCLVPDGDLFEAMNAGRATIVTDEVTKLTGDGIELGSGAEIRADVIVTATGLTLKALGGVDVIVDGRAIDLAETVGYKGMMLSGIPNMALVLGYTNASWTLKADLVSEYVCRLLGHMEAHGYDACVPREPGPSVRREPFLDLQAGYVLRSIEDLPKQGSRAPWRLHQNYVRDVLLLRHGKLEDEGVSFERRATAAAPAPLAG
jgi:cation diffusion facilitator CzcD-associated flavoprotein CzcO